MAWDSRLLVLLCVLVSLFSASTTASAGPRVRASDLLDQVVAGRTASLAVEQRASGSLLAAKGGALVVRNPISRHAAERLAERGITRGMANKAIEKGTQYADRLNGTISHVLEGGMASGKTLQIATNPATGEEVFKNAETGEQIIRHTITRGGEILHETFRTYSKFGG